MKETVKSGSKKGRSLPRILRRALYLFLFLAGFHSAEKFCDDKTDKFRITRISSRLTYDPRWEARSAISQQDLESILSQPFHYLASGGQSFVFLSQDKQYVLKFFKHYRREFPRWVEEIPLPAFLDNKRCEKILLRRGKLERDFQSYKLSCEELSAETGVLYTHLNKKSGLLQKATLIDKLQINHTIDLDDFEFVVQKRGELVYPHIVSLMRQKRLDEARQAVASVVSLIVNRSQKGIFDEDARIHRNFGFIDNRAVILDAGRLVKDPSRKEGAVYKRDLHKITEPFKRWMEKRYPELVPELDHALLMAYENRL